MYKGDINNMFDKYELNENAKALINTIQTKMKQKKLTDNGKEWKKRIISMLFYKQSTLLLNSIAKQIQNWLYQKKQRVYLVE